MKRNILPKIVGAHLWSGSFKGFVISANITQKEPNRTQSRQTGSRESAGCCHLHYNAQLTTGVCQITIKPNFSPELLFASLAWGDVSPVTRFWRWWSDLLPKLPSKQTPLEETMDIKYSATIANIPASDKNAQTKLPRARRVTQTRKQARKSSWWDTGTPRGKAAI